MADIDVRAGSGSQGSDEERERLIGVGLATLLLSMSAGVQRDGWVHIRVEHLRLLSATTVRREMSVDFTYPVDVPAVGHMLAMTTPLLPLTLLTKGARLAGFSVHDEQDRRLPILTRPESAREAATCLVALARTIATIRQKTLTPEVIEAFRLVATLPHDQAVDLLGRMRIRAWDAAPSPSSAVQAFGPGWRDFVPSANSCARIRSLDRSLAAHAGLLWALLSEQTLNTLARGLATQFMLLTPL